MSKDRNDASRSDILDFLLWAERQGSELSQGNALVGAKAANVVGDVAAIATELFTAIRFILTDGALQRYGGRTPGGAWSSGVASTPSCSAPPRR